MGAPPLACCIPLHPPEAHCFEQLVALCICYAQGEPPVKSTELSCLASFWGLGGWLGDQQFECIGLYFLIPLLYDFVNLTLLQVHLHL